MTRGLFATMLERADTKEAIGLNRSRLRSTRPQSNMDGLNKRLDVSKHAERVARVREAGIAVGGYFILGLDGDSRTIFGETGCLKETMDELRFG